MGPCCATMAQGTLRSSRHTGRFFPWKSVLQRTAVQQHRRCSPVCVGEECKDICVCTLVINKHTHADVRPYRRAREAAWQSRSQTRALRACVILAFICVHQCHLYTRRTNAAASSTESSEPRRGYWPTVRYYDLKLQKNLESLINGGN